MEYPGYGSVVTKELRCDKDLPPYVAIPATPLGPGYLGVEYAALQTNAVPKAGKPFDVRGISLAGNTKLEDMERRQHLLDDLDDGFRGYEATSDLLVGLDRFSKQAQEIIESKRARGAFDVSRESPEVARLFGETDFGLSCMLAVRLIESGIRFATVGFSGWDTHAEKLCAAQGSKSARTGRRTLGLVPGLGNERDAGVDGGVRHGRIGRTPKIIGLVVITGRGRCLC